MCELHVIHIRQCSPNPIAYRQQHWRSRGRPCCIIQCAPWPLNIALDRWASRMQYMFVADANMGLMLLGTIQQQKLTECEGEEGTFSQYLNVPSSPAFCEESRVMRPFWHAGSAFQTSLTCQSPDDRASWRAGAWL